MRRVAIILLAALLLAPQASSAGLDATTRPTLPERGADDHRPPCSKADGRACLMEWARRRSADYVLVTTVPKENRLILMVNMLLADVAHSGRPATGGMVDLRGDTDATRLAAAGQLLERTLNLKMPS